MPVLTQAQQTELSKSLRKTLESAFMQATDSWVNKIKDSAANDNDPNTQAKRRAPNGASPSGQMEAVRRLTKSIKNLNKFVDNAEENFGDLNKTMTSSVKNLGKHMDAAGDIYGDLNKTLKGYHSELERTERLYGDVQSKMTRTIRDHQKVSDVMGDQLKVHKKMADIDNIRINREKEYVTHLRDMNKAAKEFVEQVRESQNNPNPNTPDGPGNDNGPGPGGRGAQQLGLFGKAAQLAGNKLTSLASVSTGLKMIWSDMQYAMSTSAKVGVNTLTDSLQMGMTARSLLEMQSEFRADAMRMSGGTNEWTSTLRKSQMDLVTFTGSLAEANKVNAELRNSYLKMGFSIDDITSMLGKTSDGMISNFTKMSAITGKTVSEIGKVMASITGSDENRELLLKMTKEQRAEYVQGQTKQLQQYTVLTGSVERAQQMMDQQNRNANRTALDRYKESIRMKAAGTMMGMDAGSMDTFVELSKKAPGTLTETDKTEMATIRDQLSRRIKELQGGNFQDQLMADTMVQRLDLSGLSLFDTSLDVKMDADAIADQQMSNLANVMNNTPFGKESVAILSSVDSVLKQSITPILASMLLAMGHQALGRGSIQNTRLGREVRAANQGISLGELDAQDREKQARKKASDDSRRRRRRGRMGRLARSVPGLGSNTMLAGLGSQIMNPSVGMAKYLKVGAGGVASLATMAGGALVDNNWDPKTASESKNKEHVMDSINTAGWAMMGATIGTFIAPGVGTAVGAAVGGISGAIYEFSNDNWAKTANEMKQKNFEQANERHSAEMKFMQAGWEYRKSNFDAFQKEAGPEFKSKVQTLMDKWNSSQTKEQQVSLDSVTKFADLKQYMSDKEFQYIEMMYKDEKSKMAERHNLEMTNMKAIHTLNLEKSGAYQALTKAEARMTALDDLDTTDLFTSNGLNVSDLKSITGTDDASVALGELRQIAKMSMSPDDYAKMKDSGMFADWSKALSEGKSELSLHQIDSDLGQDLAQKFLTSLEDGPARAALEKQAKAQMSRAESIIAGVDTKIVELEAAKADQQVSGKEVSELDNPMNWRIDQSKAASIDNLPMSNDAEGRADFGQYLQGLKLSDGQINRMGGTSEQDLINKVFSGNAITNKSLMQVVGDHLDGGLGAKIVGDKEERRLERMDLSQADMSTLGASSTLEVANKMRSEDSNVRDDTFAKLKAIKESRIMLRDQNTNADVIDTSSINMKNMMSTRHLNEPNQNVDIMTPSNYASVASGTQVGTSLDATAASVGTTSQSKSKTKSNGGSTAKSSGSKGGDKDQEVGNKDEHLEIAKQQLAATQQLDATIKENNNKLLEASAIESEKQMISRRPRSNMSNFNRGAV